MSDQIGGGPNGFEEAILRKVEAVSKRLDEMQVILTLGQRSTLQAKLIYYFRNGGLQTAPTIVDAIIGLGGPHKNQLLDEKRGITIRQALRLHDEKMRRIAKELAKEKLEGDFTGIFTSSDRKWIVSRANGAEAFKAVTAQMGNCLGGTHLDYYLNLTRDGTRHIYVMHAGEDIQDQKTGKVLHKRGDIVIAIEYNAADNSIVQIEGSHKANRRQVTTDNAYINGLLEFLSVSHERGLASVRAGVEGGVQRIQHDPNEILTSRGVIPISNLELDDIQFLIYDEIKIQPSALDTEQTRRKLLKLMEKAQITWNLGGAPQDFKDSIVECAGTIRDRRIVTKRDERPDFIYPNLESAGSLDMYCSSLGTFKLPRLRTVGKLKIDGSVVSCDLNSLELADSIALDAISERIGVDLPSLMAVNKAIKIGEWQYVKAGRLATCGGNISINVRQNIDLPKLRTSGDMTLDATTCNLAGLESAGILKLGDRVKVLNAPNLNRLAAAKLSPDLSNHLLIRALQGTIKSDDVFNSDYILQHPAILQMEITSSKRDTDS